MIVPQPWDYTEFVHKMQRSLGEGIKVETFCIDGISKCSSSSLNEILDAAITYCCQEQGLKEITLEDIMYSGELKFDEYLLKRMIERTKNLEKLKISELR